MRPYSLVYKYEPLGESFCFPVHYHDDGSCKLLKTLKEKLSSKIQRSYTRTVVSAGSVCLICRRQFRYQSCSRLGGPRGRFRWVQKISPPLPPPFPRVSNTGLFYLHKHLQCFTFHSVGNLTEVIFVMYVHVLSVASGMRGIQWHELVIFSLSIMPVRNKDLSY